MIQPCDLDFNCYLSILLDDNDYDRYYKCWTKAFIFILILSVYSLISLIFIIAL